MEEQGVLCHRLCNAPNGKWKKIILNCLIYLRKCICEMFGYDNCMIIENEIFIQMYILYCTLL